MISLCTNRWRSDKELTFLLLSLRWRHNGRDSGSNHQPHDCLLNRLFRRKSKKISELRVIGLCEGNSPGPVNSPHKSQVTRKWFHLMTLSWCCHWEALNGGNKGVFLLYYMVIVLKYSQRDILNWLPRLGMQATPGSVTLSRRMA